MGSSTRSCLRNAGKLGTAREMEKKSSRYPGENFITLLATTVDRKATMLGTVNAPLKPILKKVRKYSGRQNMKNTPTRPLVEET